MGSMVSTTASSSFANAQNSGYEREDMSEFSKRSYISP